MNSRLSTVSAVSLLTLVAIVGAVFLFVVSISPYPAGDDPGFHTSVLAYLLDRSEVRFELPYFPQLQQLWGAERFVTKIALVTLSRLTGVTDVFQLHITFTAFFLSAALVPMYLLMTRMTRSTLSAAVGITFLGFTKFYQENFLEGSYDQYTGLLLLSVLVYGLFRWRESRGGSWLILATILVGVLYKTHELGFLVGLSLYVLSLIEFAHQAFARKGLFLSVTGVTLLLGVLGYLKPQSFVISGISYPIKVILSSAEGVTTIAGAFILIGFGLLLTKKHNSAVLAWLLVTVVFTQSSLLGSPFYAFRFNLYLLQVFSVLIALAIAQLLQFLRRVSRIQQLLVVTVVLGLIIIPQIRHVTLLGRWITSQRINPISVILTEDVEAFRWIRDNTPPSAIILASFKWGYYLPALSRRSVVIDEAVGGDSRDSRFELAEKAKSVYETADARLAYETAKKLGVSYVVWDAALTRFRKNYRPFYVQDKFNDPKYFQNVYAKSGVYIYEVI